MPNLNDNKDYAELLTAYKNVLDALSLQNSGLNALANGTMHTKRVELRDLHSVYTRLLEWLSLPENKDAKAEYLGLEISTGLNHFFSA